MFQLPDMVQTGLNFSLLRLPNRLEASKRPVNPMVAISLKVYDVLRYPLNVFVFPSVSVRCPAASQFL